MTRNEEMRFELLIIDMLEEKNIENGKELTRFSNRLHELIEGACYEYAMDKDIYDDWKDTQKIIHMFESILEYLKESEEE